MRVHRTDTQAERDHEVAQLVDHAASYLRHRLNMGQYAGLDGRYAGYTMCGLLDNLAIDLRRGELSALVRSSLVSLTRDLAREEHPGPPLGRLPAL